MFKSTATQEARNENGVTVEIDGYTLRYRRDDHVMEFGSQPSPPLSPSYDALFTIYFPTQLKWQAPHAQESVSSEESRQIEKHIVDALQALDCQVNFTIPVNG